MRLRPRSSILRLQRAQTPRPLDPVDTALKGELAVLEQTSGLLQRRIACPDFFAFCNKRVGGVTVASAGFRVGVVIVRPRATCLCAICDPTRRRCVVRRLAGIGADVRACEQ